MNLNIRKEKICVFIYLCMYRGTRDVVWWSLWGLCGGGKALAQNFFGEPLGYSITDFCIINNFIL